ncbi:hypothetical protein B0H13DRAFT_2382351 [Mycena leptocephala]|nr:hypothetical protein B0H13DRAFT_2382351 [Mycena leptocephala]
MSGLTSSQRRLRKLQTASAGSHQVHISSTRLVKEAEEKAEVERIAALSQQQLHEYQAQHDQGDYGAGFDDYEEDVLQGRTAADISHAGEAVIEDTGNEVHEDVLEGLRAHHNQLFGRRRDYRRQADRTQSQVNLFAPQMQSMADVYMAWSLDTAEEGMGKLYAHPEDAVVEQTQRVYVVDLFTAYYADILIIVGDQFITSAYVRQGLMPVAPYTPTTVITLRTLEVFHAMSLRCPQFTIHTFVWTICDLHVDGRVQVALGRNTPNWRLKNVCPTCLYELQGEVPIPLPFLCTFDGNNSLSHFEIKTREEIDEDGNIVPGKLREHRDDQVMSGDYYLSCEEVNKWAKEGLDDLMREFTPGLELPDEGDGCAERWQNMQENVTSRAYGMYDKTGIFPALCRHRFVLVIVDMVKSGEMAKYPFAITAHLLRVLGEHTVGYDIGCRALVGSFHGHAHCCRCQLKFLAMYVKGMGLEDLEECESFFSKSNALTSTTQYASAFHRQQAITTCLAHSDTANAYQGLTILIANKYRRVLQIRRTEGQLRETMAALGVESRSVFETWLEKEKEYLESLTKEPEEETLQMEYYQKLVSLQDYEERLNTTCNVAAMFVPAEATSTIETQRRHALELYSKALDAVQDLELCLSIERCWVPGDEEWIATAKMLGNRRYQRVLDALEGLVIAHMFELTKVNMSDTGYKLRKHIAKALQVPSKAIKTALETFNKAAAALTPPQCELTWEEIVDYVFLTDFDLLREGREDIRGKPWAQPAGRAAMDQHFKLLQADKEIAWLNLEIPRLVTYMRDEEHFLTRQEDRLRAAGEAALAHQVGLWRLEQARFDGGAGVHGSALPGVSIDREHHQPATLEDANVAMPPAPPTATAPPLDDPEDDEEGGDADFEALATAYENIMRVSGDAPAILSN